MSLNMHLETIIWLNRQIDDINTKSTLIGEMFMEETDPLILKKLDNKLAEFEKQLDDIGRKIEIERKLILAAD